MDCIVAFASPPNPRADEPPSAGRARDQLTLPPTPNLNALLACLAETDFQTNAGNRDAPLSLSTPAEQVRAQWMGLQAPDGRIPWAALEAAAMNKPSGETAWAWFHPCHWHIAHDHVRLLDPAALGLSEAHSRALLAVLAPFLAEDGIQLHYHSPTKWLAHGEALADLPCASLDRVIGRRLEPWMDVGGSGARHLRRLQQEVQMLLYTHHVSGAPGGPATPVNSFWVSGAGRLADAWSASGDRRGQLRKALDTPVEQPQDLRAPSLSGDAGAWSAAWTALDAGPLAKLWTGLQSGQPVRLALCGERGARVFAGQGVRWQGRLRRALGLAPRLADIGETI